MAEVELSFLIFRLADLELGLPSLGAQELLQNKHICRSVSKLKPTNQNGTQIKISNQESILGPNSLLLQTTNNPIVYINIKRLILGRIEKKKLLLSTQVVEIEN